MLTNPLQLQKQNLINQVSVEKVVRPAGFYTGIVIDTLAVVAALIAGLCYRVFLYGTLNVAYLLIAVGVFLVFAVLSMMLNPGVNRRVGVLAAQAVALCTFFYDTELQLLIPTVGALLLFFVWGDYLGQRELDQSLNIRFFRIARSQLAKLVTGMVIAGVVFALPQWSAQDDFIPQAKFQVVYNWGAGLFARYYPDIRVNSSVENFAESLAVYQLKSNKDYASATPEVQARIADTTTKELITKMASLLRLTADIQGSFSIALYDFLRLTMADWQKQYSTEFIIVLGIAVFLVVRGLATIFYFIALAVAFFLYQILIASNVIAVLGETRTKEIIQYS
jgi:hypothetical protein